MTELILHPKTVELRRRRDLLRSRLAELVGRRLALQFEEIPSLRYRYTELFGGLEREVEEKTLEMSQRRRMMELFMLKLDRGQELDEKTITLTLKAVYREFERLRGQVQRMASGTPRTEGTGSPPPYGSGPRPAGAVRTPEARLRDERIECKKLYRKLAKRLHPDITAGADPLEKTFWEMTRRGYERGDVELLRTLVNVVESGPAVGREGRIESTAEEIVRLLEIVDREERRLEEMETTEPWSTRRKFDDADWVAERQRRLREKIRTIEEETARYDEFLAPILSRSGERITPESVADVWTNFVEDVYLSGRY